MVLDPSYGEKLAHLHEAGPVWILDTPENHTVAQRIWASSPNRSHLDGITTFKFAEASSAEDILINELDTIDLHQGTYSANPPYTIVEVIGTGINDNVKRRFADFGFDQFEPTSHGFRAIRPLPEN